MRNRIEKSIIEKLKKCDMLTLVSIDRSLDKLADKHSNSLKREVLDLVSRADERTLKVIFYMLIRR